MFDYSILSKKNDVFVQIGTNTGNDLFRQLVLKYKPKKVILVEPLPQLISSIKHFYKGIENITIINKAITTGDTTTSLFIPARDGVYGNPGVQPDRKLGNHTYDHGKFSMLPMNDWGEKKHMIEVKVSGITFEDVCKEYDIHNIDYLQIDTEGFDSEIIKSINMDDINIDILRYEKWNFGTECFTKYHPDNCDLYGINGMNAVKDKLLKYDYNISSIKDTSGDDYIAIKNSIN